MTKPPKGGVPDGADVQALLDELAVRKEWRDYGHGPLHGQSYDMITQMWALIEPPVGGRWRRSMRLSLCRLWSRGARSERRNRWRRRRILIIPMGTGGLGARIGDADSVRLWRPGGRHG